MGVDDAFGDVEIDIVEVGVELKVVVNLAVELVDELPLADSLFEDELVEIELVLADLLYDGDIVEIELLLGEGESDNVLVNVELILEEPVELGDKVFEDVLETFDEKDNGISCKVINIWTPVNTTEPSVINVIRSDGVFEIYLIVFDDIFPALLKTFASNEL